MKTPTKLKKVQISSFYQLILAKIFPLKQNPIFSIKLDSFSIKNPNIFYLKLEALKPPDITDNLCSIEAKVNSMDLLSIIKETEIEDIYMSAILDIPEIESFDLKIEVPEVNGKSYISSKKKEGKQSSLFDDKSEICVHGLKKSWCSICNQKNADEEIINNKSTRNFNVFDLIFPILQPPLGEEFDNTLVMPKDKSLYNFQNHGVKFLVENNRALLGDEMGLGKSIQAIMALRVLFRKGKVSTGVIVSPKSVLFDWERKLREWAPELRLLRVHGPKAHREICWDSPTHIYLTTYETLRSDLRTYIAKESEENSIFRKINIERFDFVILDEIQRIKNPSAKVTQAIRKIDAPVRWGLSGTPLENKTSDIISIFKYLVPSLLTVDDSDNLPYIKQKIKQYMLRRRIKDALPDLPDKIHRDVWLELSEEQMKTYKAIEEQGIKKLKGKGNDLTVHNVFALINQLKQVCNIDYSSEDSCKVDYLLEKLNEVTEDGNKALVFSQFPNVTLKRIEPRLRKFNPLIFDGSINGVNRDKRIMQFQNEERNKIMLMSVKAGGQGITLTRANHVYHFDHWWNPATASQAEGRAYRIGQNKTVFVNHLYTVGTIEERIYDLLEEKKNLFRNVVDDLSDTSSLTKLLSEEEIFSLFNLKKTERV